MSTHQTYNNLARFIVLVATMTFSSQLFAQLPNGEKLGRYWGTGIKFAPGELAISEKTGNVDGGIGAELALVFRTLNDFDNVESNDFLIPMTVNGHIPLRFWTMGMSANIGVGALVGFKFLPARVLTQTGYIFNIGLDYKPETMPLNFSLEWSPRRRFVHIKEPFEATEKFTDWLQFQIGVRYTGLFKKSIY